MIQLYGVFLKENKSFYIQIQKIFGIGSFRAKILCKILGISLTCKLDNLTPIQIRYLKRFLDKKFVLGSELKKRINDDIDRLKRIKCYRGFRHLMSLPTRGQRSKTNAKTQKRKKKTNLFTSSKFKGKKGKKKLKK